MKSIFALALVSLSLTAAASWKLESHYGKLFTKKGMYFCSLTNDTGRDLDLKYVHFHFMKAVGSDTNIIIQNRIDKILLAGETLVEPAGVNVSHISQTCKFMAR